MSEVVYSISESSEKWPQEVLSSLDDMLKIYLFNTTLLILFFYGQAFTNAIALFYTIKLCPKIYFTSLS